MTDRPIPFVAPMIRALLDGRKTMTRRVLKLPKKTFSGGPIYERADMGGWEPTTNGGGSTFTIVDGQRVPRPETVGMWHKTTGVAVDAPYQTGDRLWVRETARGEELQDGHDGVRFRADDRWLPIANSEEAANLWLALHTYRGHSGAPVGQWVPPIHMPRWVSRLTLIVEDVRVERLQEISEADAIAEGMQQCATPQSDSFGAWSGGVDFRYGWNARGAFHRTWELLHGPDAWSVNPWVAVISFRVIRANIDSKEAHA